MDKILYSLLICPFNWLFSKFGLNWDVFSLLVALLLKFCGATDTVPPSSWSRNFEFCEGAGNTAGSLTSINNHGRKTGLQLNVLPIKGTHIDASITLQAKHQGGSSYLGRESKPDWIAQRRACYRSTFLSAHLYSLSIVYLL